MAHDRLRRTSPRNLGARNFDPGDMGPGPLTMLAWVVAAFLACSALGMTLLTNGDAIGRALAH